MDNAVDGVRKVAFQLKPNTERDQITAERRQKTESESETNPPVTNTNQQSATVGKSEGATGVNSVTDTNPAINPDSK